MLQTNTNSRPKRVKQLAFRLDGLFLPIVADSQLPFYIVEVQFQPDPNLYYRLFAELFIYLKQYQPPHPWQLVVIYPNRQTERECDIHFQEMLALPKTTRIYLDELREPETASLPIKLLKLVIEPENTGLRFGYRFSQTSRNRNTEYRSQRELRRLT